MKMSHPSTLDLDRHTSLEKSRRSNSRSQTRVQARDGDPLCDFCTTRKQKAEKSCLVCLASYCETHLQSHYEYPALMKHKLVKATGQMREKMCAQHDKLLEAFCRTDETSVCVLCMMDEHKHHDIVPAGTERTEKQVRAENNLLIDSLNIFLQCDPLLMTSGMYFLSVETTWCHTAQISTQDRPEN
uniref:B box-type domain-containing protein n=1 Tax=Acanthochromis polyacanthus TaxID=80966 RepID=A0A3Q1FGH8_9TELE